MTPPRSITDTVMNWPWVRNPFIRRIALGLAALLFLLLALFPKPYKVTTELLPNDSGGSLSSTLGGGVGGAGLFSYLFGGGQSIEVDLSIGRSQAVMLDLARTLRRENVIKIDDAYKASNALRKRLRVEVARGSILKVDYIGPDPKLGLQILNAYTSTIRARLSALNLSKTAERKVIAQQRMDAAVNRLAQAQAALIQFKTAHRLGAPEMELGATSALITGLEAQLQAERTNLQNLSRFATNQNIGVQASQTRIASLENQIAQARTNPQANGAASPALGSLTPQLTQYENLFREERYAEAEYLIYERYLDAIRIDELAAGINLDVVEPPFVDARRQYHTPFLGLLALTLIFAAFAEFYVAPPRRGG